MIFLPLSIIGEGPGVRSRSDFQNILTQNRGQEALDLGVPEQAIRAAVFFVVFYADPKFWHWRPGTSAQRVHVLLPAAGEIQAG